jgi:acetyl-CoA carboxylase biotin carboxyl carrier protein
MALSDDDVREILRLIDESDLDELRVETQGFSLHVRRDGAPGEAPAAAAREPSGGPSREPPRASGRRMIEAPMLGTFYRAEGPGADPFVEVGSAVQPDTVVCIIEVMKMMNSIRAGVAGRILAIKAENAELIEEGQPLFEVEVE